MQNFKLVIKTIMKNLCVKETKHIIFIDLKSSEFLNPNNYLWNLLSIIIKGVNICMIFEKKEMIEIMNLLKKDVELDAMKFDHKIYKISKKLMNSIKFVLSIDKNDNDINKKIQIRPEIVLKSFLKFPLKEIQINLNELENIEKIIIDTSMTAEKIRKIEYSINLELMLSPHFEDFYHFNLLKSKDNYMILTEILSKNIMKSIEEKHEHLKSTTLFGKMDDYLKKNKNMFKEQINSIEKNNETSSREIEKWQKEISENKLKIEDLNKEIAGKAELI